MTQFEIKVLRRLLDELHDTDGGLLSEIQLHGAIGGTAFCSASQLTGMIALADTRHWITGVRNETTGLTMWGISPRGEKARTEL